MAGHRDLIVWQKSMDLVVEIYRLVKKLPREETYSLSDQMRRAVVSIPSNIAEGNARDYSSKDIVHFLSMAQGSRAELDTQLEICARLNFFSQDEINIAAELSAQIRRMLAVMIRNKKESQQKPKSDV